MANNPYVNKVQLADGTPLIDLTDTTAGAAQILEGYTAYGATGQKLTGTATIPPPNLQTKSVSYTPSETAQSETVTADSGYDGLDEVDVSVAAVSSTYVGSGITRRSSTDMTASGATVIAPAGYYSSSASKSVATGTAGTPTASKGTVSNHSVSVTPSVTNTAGYISGGTKTGTAVTVSASELVSGTLSITSGGTNDVTNYASASVASGTAGTPTATKGTVSNHSVDVTPSVTNTAGYITGGTKTGTAVTVSASELVSGTKSISSNGTAIDVTNYASVDVAVSPSLQSKNKMFTPTESAQAETITADTGYDGLSSVQATVRAIPENYVYSTIPRRDSTDLSVSGYTVTAPIGYYASNASKTVNVPFVKGSFTTGSSSGSSYIDLPYTGNGYPIAVMVFLQDGTYNPDSSVYSVVKRYGILAWSMTKAVTSTAPVYGSTSGVDENMGVVNAVYKSSTSDATAVTTSVNKAANVYLATAAGNAYYTAVRVRSNTRLGYYVIGSSSFGLMPSTTYDYVVIYSS